MWVTGTYHMTDLKESAWSIFLPARLNFPLWSSGFKGGGPGCAYDSTTVPMLAETWACLSPQSWQSGKCHTFQGLASLSGFGWCNCCPRRALRTRVIDGAVFGCHYHFNSNTPRLYCPLMSQFYWISEDIIENTTPSVLPSWSAHYIQCPHSRLDPICCGICSFLKLYFCGSFLEFMVYLQVI